MSAKNKRKREDIELNEVEPEFVINPEKIRPVPPHKRHIAKPGETDLRNCKVRVTMYLDADIVEHFKQRAATPNAAPYQTQINNALREFVERNEGVSEYSRLLADERFITAVAERVKGHLGKGRQRSAS